MPSTNDESFTLPERARVGRVGLRVASLDDVVPFYRDVVGLASLGDGVGDGDRDREGDDGVRDSARLGAGDEALLHLDEAPDAPARDHTEAGLFHLAIRVPDRAALGDVLRRARAHDAELTGASDHRVSEALYFRDPEGNGVEVYHDRPREAWPWTDAGGVEMETLPLDLDDLADAGGGNEGVPDGTDVGHVHLEVTDLSRGEAFYADTLGLNVRDRFGEQATFLAAGDYHHHVGLNTWNGRRERARESRGLDWFEFALPDAGTLDTVRQRLADQGYDTDALPAGVETADPDGIRVRLTVAGAD